MNIINNIKPMDIIFYGAITVIIGGIIGAIGTRLQNKNSSLKSDKQLQLTSDLAKINEKMSENIISLAEQNKSLSQDIIEVNQKNSELLKQLALANENVMSAKSEAEKNVFGSIGGYIIAGPQGNLTNISVDIFNENTLPMYDVKIHLSDYNKLLECGIVNDRFGTPGVRKDCYLKNTSYFEAPIIYGGSLVKIENFKIDNINSTKLYAKIFTKRGTYYQQFISSQKDGSGFRLLKEINQAEHFKQFIYRDPSKPFKYEAQQFEVIKEESLNGRKIDWDKEFPLGVDFALIHD